MRYAEDEYLQMNGIQHFVFCKRQWALMTIEQVWVENALTREGHYLHETTDKPFFDEKRKGVIIVRAMPLVSHELGLNGIADVVEFIEDPNGIKIAKREGLWRPYIVEYKKGRKKNDLRDIVQLVAEVMALEEMLSTEIHESAIYYKQTNKREKVVISQELKENTKCFSEEMHEIVREGITPKASSGKVCSLCSLNNLCMPRLTNRKKSVLNYIEAHEKEL
jgi:CRISPR-associated exonuclease Cas4